MRIPRFSVWRVDLNPVKGSEQSGYRPVLVVSPDVMNGRLKTVIVAPMTTVLRGWPTRVKVMHDGQVGEVALDQIRAIDKQRLGKPAALLDEQYHGSVIDVLSDIFSF